MSSKKTYYINDSVKENEDKLHELVTEKAYPVSEVKYLIYEKNI